MKSRAATPPPVTDVSDRPLKLMAWRDWLMQRLGEKPDITTR
jgi:hypothetical protein